MANVNLAKVNKKFGKTHVIHDVDLDIDDGEFVVFVGPSGCGKSTLLRLIAGLEDITSGDMQIGGRSVTHLLPAERGIGMVFQSYALYPHMTVYENMAFGLELARSQKHLVKERVEHAAHILQLESLLDRKPKELSGGQRQRVAIGRAIVREPNVFLFDEPLSNLDAALRVQMRIEIAALHERLSSTMIYVTHDQVEAMTLANKIVVLNQGRVEQVGSPLTLYNHPANVFVAGFIGSPKMNMLPVQLRKTDHELSVVTMPTGADIEVAVDTSRTSEGDKVTLGIRPEHCILGEQDVFSGKSQVMVVEQLGNESLLHIQVEALADPLVIRQDGQSAVQRNTPVAVTFPAGSCHLFDAQGRVFGRSSAAVYDAQPQTSAINET